MHTLGLDHHTDEDGNVEGVECYDGQFIILEGDDSGEFWNYIIGGAVGAIVGGVVAKTLTVVNLLQRSNALLPIWVTLAGIVSVVIFSQ